MVKEDYITVTEPVPDPPVAAFTANPTTGNAPLEVTFTDWSTGEITTKTIDYGDQTGYGALNTGYGQTFTHTYDEPGAYTVRLTATGPGGCDTETKIGLITVRPKLEVDFQLGYGYQTTGEAPHTVKFEGTSNGDITEWHWAFGDGATDNISQAPEHEYTKAGRYLVTLVVRDSLGRTAVKVKPDYIIVTAAEDDPLDAEFTISDESSASGTAPHTVSFVDLSEGNITDRYWYFGDGGTSNEKDPTYTYKTPGIYTVTLAVRDAGANIDAEQKRYFIDVTYPAPIARFTAAPLTGDAPLAADFESTSTGAVYTWDWDFGDGESGYGETVSHTYYEPGTYTVALDVSGPGGSDIETKTGYIRVQSNYKDFNALKLDIEAAYTGEEIEIAPGIYEFTSDLEIKKDIVLTSTDPKRTLFDLGYYQILIKDPDVESGYGEFGRAEDVILRGITIRARKVEKVWANTGYGLIECAKKESIDNGPIENHAALLTLEDCRIMDNEGVRVSALYCAPYSELKLKNVLIANNTNIPARTTASYASGYQTICYAGALFLDKYASAGIESSTIGDNIDKSLPQVENAATGYGQIPIPLEYGAIHRNNAGISDNYEKDYLSMTYSIMWNNGRVDRLKDVSQRKNSFLYRDISHSDIQQTEVKGTGTYQYIIHVDPQFDSKYEQQNPRYCSGMGVDY